MCCRPEGDLSKATHEGNDPDNDGMNQIAIHQDMHQWLPRHSDTRQKGSIVQKAYDDPISPEGDKNPLL
jgi:hypothetical protein